MTDDVLTEFGDCDQVSTLVEDCDRIGIDTEFMRERTYFAQLCLVQIATESDKRCLDPLAGEGNPEKSWDLLLAKPWVLHSGRQDIEVVYQQAGNMPSGVFDTQIAAALLGYQPQIGYAGLVSELFDVTLDKSHTRADWSVRPLSPQMLRYAIEDVEYLLPAYDALRERLDRAGRLEWAVQDSAGLLDEALYASDAKSAIQRLKGARNLKGAARRVASRIAAWREEEAIRSDRPRQWILRDSVVIALAMNRPSNIRQLRLIEDFPERTLRRAGNELLRQVELARSETDDYRPPVRPDENQKRALKMMQAYVQEVASDLGIAAEIIAPKKELSAAMLGDTSGRVFRGWREEIVGAELRNLISAFD